jgi:hypothetical protein
MAASLNDSGRLVQHLLPGILRRAPLLGAVLACAASLLVPTAGALARPNFAPVPAISIGVASQLPLGEPFSFTVTFDNTSGNPSDVG